MASVRSDVLDPVHLTALLRTAGELGDDQIAHVVVETGSAGNAILGRGGVECRPTSR